MENFVVNKDHTIHSVLERPFYKMVLDHLVSDDITPVEVKSKVDGIIKGWTRKKAMLKSVPDLWQCQYLLLNYVDDNTFSGVMDAISLDDLTHEGVLTNTRPITLIETARKIFSKLLSDKILSVCSLFNVLREDNFFVLKDTTTQSLIFAIGSVVKDALEKDHELWLVLQNICKAYDSRLDPKGSVPHWFTLVCDFLDQSSISDDLHVVSSQDANVYSLGVISRLGQCLSSANMGVVNVYTDRLLKNLGSGEMKCGATAYFSDLGLSIGAKIGGLVSLTMIELQTIALVLECVPLNSFVVVYSDSQAALDACVAESALGKWLDVSWHKVKRHSGVVDNERADELASLAASSFLALPVLVKKRFIKTNEVVISENIHYFAHEIFRSIDCAYWEIDPGFNVIDDSLLGDMNWFCTALVWHPNSHMATGFTIAVRKCLYSKAYSSVLCLHCGEVESSDHSFVCTFDSNAHKSILRFHLAKWHCVSGLDLHLSRVSQEASSILDDAKVVGRFIVDFVQELGAAHHTDIWVIRAKYRALMEKGGLILLDSSVYPMTHGLSYMFSIEVIRLLEIAETVDVCFGFRGMVSVLIDS
ncbi:hypothetical protein G9A89_016069 [Geosiphon pyriformis]|nr:hypothetical protein G9A89_016069 [Geosiphon pyriformis]